MTARPGGSQRGVALLALVALLSIGAMWYLTSWLQEQSANIIAAERDRNAQVLSRAKRALIGYVITQANYAGENNPGALPCPEAPGSFNETNGTDGKTNSAGCALPAVGRFPWRTIGTDKLVDASGEPLWYVVSPGWAKTCVTCTTTINSNSAGQLNIDGVAATAMAPADTVVALIIAPARAFSASAATGCTAWNQARPATSGAAPDVRNYLECDNANGDASFVTSGPSAAFNDQVVKITVADVMPGIEAAIADRIEREIAPLLKTVYNGPTWASNLSATRPVYPFPAPFPAPPATPSTISSYQGSNASCTASVCRGLLPVIFTNQPGSTTALCMPGASSLCNPMFVAWASGTIEVKQITVPGYGTYVPGGIPATLMIWGSPVTSCTVSVDPGPPQFSRLDCDAYVPGIAGLATTNVVYEFRGIASNIGMALRQFNAAPSLPGITISTAPTVSMASTGSATTTFRGTTANVPTGLNLVPLVNCALGGTIVAGTECRRVSIQVPLPPFFPDHALLDSSNATTGWFMRNEWYRLLHYAVARGFTPEVIASAPNVPACPTTSPSYTFASSCLSVTNVMPAASQRSILILAGRSLNGAARPSSLLEDYLEFGNVTGNFEQQIVGPMAYRDQSAPAVPTAYTDTGAANAYMVSATSVRIGQPLYFKVKNGNTNTGGSTLNAPATGVKAIVNSDGSGLAASQIMANSVVQVSYDGTQYVLVKRPFNDRIVVVDSN
jgi:hypothetical protein